MEIKHQLYRPITHPEYKYEYTRNSNWLEHYIYIEAFYTGKGLVGPKSKHVLYADDHFYSEPVGKEGAEIIGLALFIIFLGFSGLAIFTDDNDLVGFALFLYILSIIGTLLCILYYFTKKKELILNRMDGTITFSGWLWMKNCTMPFDKAIFAMGQRSVLILLGPTWFPTYVVLSGSRVFCYEKLSFMVWYMDKNRPLPPGSAFDPYRQRDFDRRKAEGFPDPLYDSAVPTPEASKEHTKEKINFFKQKRTRSTAEINSRWYDPKVDSDWILTKCEDIVGDKISEFITTYKYIFDDGTIVFAKQEGKQKVMMPPPSMNFEVRGYNT